MKTIFWLAWIEATMVVAAMKWNLRLDFVDVVLVNAFVGGWFGLAGE